MIIGCTVDLHQRRFSFCLVNTCIILVLYGRWKLPKRPINDAVCWDIFVSFADIAQINVGEFLIPVTLHIAIWSFLFHNPSNYQALSTFYSSQKTIVSFGLW